MARTYILLFSFCLVLLGPGCQRRKEAPVKAVAQPAAETAAAAPVAVEQENETIPVSDIGVGDPKYASRLLRGFLDGNPGWKWTAQTFAVALDPPEPPEGTVVNLDLTVPVELLSRVKSVTLTTRVNGVEIGKHQYTETGRFYLTQDVPVEALKRKPVEVEFSLDKVGQGSNGRPVGVIVVGVSLSPKEQRVLDQQTASRMARVGYREVLELRRQKMPAARQTELMKLFHELPVWENTWFQNVKIEKNPLDLWMMQQIVYEIQPDFVIETGTWRGGSALYWAHTLNGMGLVNSRVITVDIGDETATAAQNPLWKKYVTFIRGSSTDPKTVQRIADIVKGRRALVDLDSDHAMKHVLNEIHAYAPMVTKGSYLVVEDTHMDGVPTYPEFGPGPMAAVRSFLAEADGKNFVQDFKREAMIMTFNPGGWLLRK